METFFFFGNKKICVDISKISLDYLFFLISNYVFYIIK